MEVNTYTGTERTKKEFGYIGSAIEMKKFENASKVLPADTTYALVVEVVERTSSESFDEVDIVTTLGIPVGFDSSYTGGLRGRYISYISVGSGKLRIQTGDGRMVCEEPLQNIHASLLRRQLNLTYVINTPTKKFIPGVIAVIDANPNFKSEVTPGQYGIYPLFEFITAAGGTVEPVSEVEVKKLYKKGLLIFFIIGGAMLAAPVIYLLVSALTSGS